MGEKLNISNITLLDDKKALHNYFKQIDYWTHDDMKSKQMLKAAQHVPQFINAVHQELKAKYGNTMKLYRGVEFTENQARRSVIKNILNYNTNDAIMLQSYKKQVVFSWTTEKKMAIGHYSGEISKKMGKPRKKYGMAFESDVPIKQILYAQTVFDSRTIERINRIFGVEINSYFWDREVIVWHNKPVKAKVIYKR